MKKTKKKTAAEWEKDYEELKKATTALASCVVFALKFDKHIGRGSGMVVNLKTMETVGPWQEKFFDALDMVGVCYDRKAYYKKKEHKRR
jgi:hypothetical protein